MGMENTCSVCPLMVKEMNKLRRMVCLLKTELDKSCNVKQCLDVSTHCNIINTSDCCTQTDPTYISNVLTSEKSCQTTFSEDIENLSLSAYDSPNSHLPDGHPTNDCESISSSRGTPTNLNIANDSLNVYSYDIENNEVIEPYTLLPGEPFNKFKLSDLDASTHFSETFDNRVIAHYGDIPYSYAGVTHRPCPISSNKPLTDLIRHLQNVLPNYRYNSILITKYEHGKKHLPYHSDDESEICADSEILTISFGQTRAIKFRAVSNKNTELSVNLSHGQVFTMTKKSQTYFEHCIPKDYSKQPRISITFRYLNSSPNPPITPNTDIPPTNLIENSSKPNCFQHTSPIMTVDQTLAGNHSSKPVTLYISSSMFRHLDPNKLKSTTQDAEVFFYPGATAGAMLTRFQQDPKASDIPTSLVKKVFVLTGSNNVDGIVQDNTGVAFHRTKHDIDNLISYLTSTFSGASLSLINVLPRVNYERNFGMNKMNYHRKASSYQQNGMLYINTEYNRNLFINIQGFRKDFYFMPASSSIPDNVHLNRIGVIRLAKHLKYVAHNM